MTPLKKYLDALKSDSRTLLMWAVGALLVTLGIAFAIFQRGYDSKNPSHAVPATERQRIEAVVRDYLLAHPEIIPEAVKRLQDKQVGEIVDLNRKQIETPFGGAWAGNPKGDVVLVEFFDYACPYCRASLADVKRLLREDKNLKVVWRDFPVLGPDSEQAALASLSAAQQNRYVAYYDSMFARGRPDRDQMIRAVRAAKMNEVRTAKDMSSQELKNEIQSNLELGRALGLTGTPSYIIGDQILGGAVGYDTLKAAIEKAREKKEG